MLLLGELLFFSSDRCDDSVVRQSESDWTTYWIWSHVLGEAKGSLHDGIIQTLLRKLPWLRLLIRELLGKKALAMEAFARALQIPTIVGHNGDTIRPN